MPNNNPVSWYKAEHNFFGDGDLSRSDEFQNKQHDVLDNYKNDYLRNFDELNKGFVDSYSAKKGGELVSTSSQDHDFRNYSSGSMNTFKSGSGSIREHDFRSPWIPKKFNGRNMFISHIDSTIFPDKTGYYANIFHKNFIIQLKILLNSRKDYEKNTHYNHFHVPNQELKSAVLTEKPSYVKLDKSVVSLI